MDLLDHGGGSGVNLGNERHGDGMDVPTTLNDPNVPTPVEEGNVAAMRQKLLD